MEKVTVKDIKEIKQQLSFGTIIKVSGKRIINMPKRFYEKMKNWYKGKKEALYDYADSERQEEIDKSATRIDSKIEKIDERLDSKYDVYEKYADSEAFQEKNSKGYDYLEALGGTINSLEAKKDKLKDKKVKVSSKSYGLFRTSRLALTKLAKAKWNNMQEKIANKKAEREEKIQKVSIAKQAISLCGKVNSAKMEMNSMIKQLEALKKQISELQKQEEDFAKKFGKTPQAYVNDLNIGEEAIDAEEVEVISPKKK